MNGKPSRRPSSSRVARISAGGRSRTAWPAPKRLPMTPRPKISPLRRVFRPVLPRRSAPSSGRRAARADMEVGDLGRPGQRDRVERCSRDVLRLKEVPGGVRASLVAVQTLLEGAGGAARVDREDADAVPVFL